MTWLLDSIMRIKDEMYIQKKPNEEKENMRESQSDEQIVLPSNICHFKIFLLIFVEVEEKEQN